MNEERSGRGTKTKDEKLEQRRLLLNCGLSAHRKKYKNKTEE